MLIENDPAIVGKKVDGVKRVILTEVMLAGDKRNVPNVYILEFMNMQGDKARLGVTIEDMNRLYLSIEDVLTKFPDLRK